MIFLDSEGDKQLFRHVADELDTNACGKDAITQDLARAAALKKIIHLWNMSKSRSGGN